MLTKYRFGKKKAKEQNRRWLWIKTGRCLWCSRAGSKPPGKPWRHLNKPKNFHLHPEGCEQVKGLAPSFWALAGKTTALPDVGDGHVVPAISTPKIEVKISFTDQ